MVDNSYEYRNANLTGEIMRSLILKIYPPGEEIKRADLFRQIEEYHVRMGGKESASNDPPNVLKKTLTLMQAKGEIEKRGDLGYWRILGSEQSPDASQMANSVSALFRPEKILGAGGGMVYSMYFPQYREYANLKGKIKWEIKIGCTRSLHRVRELAATSAAEYPVIPLLIRCEEEKKMERAIHAWLDLAGRRRTRDHGPGREFFVTNPDEIEQIYLSLTSLLDN